MTSTRIIAPTKVKKVEKDDTFSYLQKRSEKPLSDENPQDPATFQQNLTKRKLNLMNKLNSAPKDENSCPNIGVTKRVT